MPEISVIVPVSQEEGTLSRCVESILRQSFADLELLLIDGGTAGKCGLLCDSFARQDERVRVIHGGSGGPPSSRNAGLEKAAGKYVLFASASDWLGKDFLKVARGILADSQADYVQGKILPANALPPAKKGPLAETFGKQQALEAFFTAENRVPHAHAMGKLIRMDLLRKLRFTEGGGSQDVDFCYKLLLRCKKTAIAHTADYYYSGGEEPPHAVRSGDLYLLDMWDTVVRLSKQDTPQAVRGAEMCRCRAGFGLLCHMAKYGCDHDVDFFAVKRLLVKRCRAHLSGFLRGKGSAGRKLLFLSACASYPIFAAIARRAKWI